MAATKASVTLPSKQQCNDALPTGPTLTTSDHGRGRPNKRGVEGQGPKPKLKSPLAPRTRPDGTGRTGGAGLQREGVPGQAGHELGAGMV